MIPITLRKEIDDIVNNLKRRYHPQEIILFGSLAQGQGHSGSDIDLVVKRTRKTFFNRLRGVALLHRAHVGVDILVYTPREWEQLQREGRKFVVDEVLRKGRVLYRAA